MSVLVVGGHGQLGRALRRIAPGWTYASRDDLDLRGAVDLSAWRPTVVVNAAAYTAVDRAESEPELAFEVNAHGAGRLARACAEVGAPLIHVSTDYVFDGLKGAPYEVDDPVCPLSVYGRSKEAGEAEVRAAWAQHVILRTAWLFGPDRAGFVSWVVDQGRRGVDVPLVDDQRGNPTPVDGLAARIVALVGRLDDGCWGTWHAVGEPGTTWLGFGEALLQHAGGRAHGVAAATLNRSAIRPTDGRLVPTWPAALPALDWREGLGEVVRAWIATSSTP